MDDAARALAYTGRRIGQPQMASVGAAVQRFEQARGNLSLPAAYVISDVHKSIRGMVAEVNAGPNGPQSAPICDFTDNHQSCVHTCSSKKDVPNYITTRLTVGEQRHVEYLGPQNV